MCYASLAGKGAKGNNATWLLRGERAVLVRQDTAAGVVHVR